MRRQRSGRQLSVVAVEHRRLLTINMDDHQESPLCSAATGQSAAKIINKHPQMVAGESLTPLWRNQPEAVTAFLPQGALEPSQQDPSAIGVKGQSVWHPNKTHPQFLRACHYCSGI